MASDLDRELEALSADLVSRGARAPAQWSMSTPRQKSYSLVPVETAVNSPLRSYFRPSDQQLLRAYDESPWLHIKIARLGSAFASLPFRVVIDREPEPIVLPKTHPLSMLLRYPNPALRGWDFRFLTELYQRTVGACWWRMIPNQLGVPGQLWVYPTHWVSLPSEPGQPYTVSVPTLTGRTKTERVPWNQMLWVRIPDPVDPYSKGLGDAVSLATEVDTFELASESDRRFFQNDATPPGALVVPARLEQEEIGKLRDDWAEKYGGPSRQGTVPVLYGGMDFKTFRQGRKEMDFIDGQRYLRDVLIAGVHKHVLGITDDVNFAAAKAADYQVSKWELAPRVPWWEDHTQVIASLFDTRLAVRWDEVVPQDEEFELTKANEGLLRGAITRNEWRKANRFSALPPKVGDVFIVPPGMVEIPLDGGEPRTPAPAPAPSGGAPPADDEDEDEADEGKARAPIAPARKQFELTEREIAELILAFADDDTRIELAPAYESVFHARLSDVATEVGFKVDITLQDPAMLYYMRNVAGERIRRVNDTTRDHIREQITEGTKAGETLADLEQRIISVFDEAKAGRASIIARTETIDASNATARAAYERSGVVEQVEWLLAPDYNPEEDDGECEELAALSPVPVTADFGGGIAWPPAHPNCRCAVAPIVAGDEESEKAAEGEGIHAEDVIDPKAESARHELNDAFGEFEEMAEDTEEGSRDQARAEIAGELRDTAQELANDAELAEESARLAEWRWQEWYEGNANPLNELEALFHNDPDWIGDRSEDELRSLRAASRLVRTQTDKVVRRYAGQDAETVRVFRGLGSGGSKWSRELKANLDEHGVVRLKPDLRGAGEAPARLLSSWTTDLDIAQTFAGEQGFIIEAEVKLSEVWGTAMESPSWFGSGYLEERELVVSIRSGIDARLWRGAAGKQIATTPMTMPWIAEELSWHRRGRKPRIPRGRPKKGYRRRWEGAARKQHITVLGREHARLERLFENRIKRTFQAQQRAVLKRLRGLRREG